LAAEVPIIGTKYNKLSDIYCSRKIKTNNRIVFYRLSEGKSTLIVDSVLFCNGRDACIAYHLCHLWEFASTVQKLIRLYTYIICTQRRVVRDEIVCKHKRITQPNLFRDSVNEPLRKTFVLPRISVKTLRWQF